VPAETAIVDYRSLFADQGKQTFVFCFRLQQTNGSLPFSFPFAANNGSCRFPCFSLYICTYMSFETATCINICYHFKRKTEAQTIFFLLPFAHCANESFSFVHLLMEKQTEIICLLTEQKGLPIYALHKTQYAVLLKWS
jgi:hypothetical protein